MKPVCILIVDDEDNYREMVERQLEPLKAIIVTCNTIECGLDRMKQLPMPDILVLDMMLPGYTEADAAIKIKEFRAINPKLVVIAISGSVEEKIEQTVMALGADLFKRKLDISTQQRIFRAIKEGVDVHRGDFEHSLRFLERLDRLITEGENRVESKLA